MAATDQPVHKDVIDHPKGGTKPFGPTKVAAEQNSLAY
jgi:hypothetical protein